MRPIASVEAADDHTVRIRTRRPARTCRPGCRSSSSCPSAGRSSTAPPRRRRFDDAEVAYVERHADGTGPFRLESFEPGNGSMMTRQPGLVGLGQYPHNIDRIEHAVIADRGARPRRPARGPDRLPARPAARPARPDRGDAGPQGRAGGGVPHHLPRHGPGQPGAALVRRQGPEPVRGPAGAAGGLPGDRRGGDPPGGHARPRGCRPGCSSRRAPTAGRRSWTAGCPTTRPRRRPSWPRPATRRASR